MKNKLLYVSVLIILFSCSDRNKRKVENGQVLIDLENAIDLGKRNVLDDIIKTIEFIPLEMNTDIPIGFANLVKVKNERYYIEDQRTHTIHIFDKDGKYINILNNRGKGPGEYIQLKGFTVGEDNNIDILTYGGILCYDENLNFINKIKIDDKGQVSDITKFKNGNYILFNNFSKSLGQKGELLTFISSDNKTIDKYGNVEAKDVNKRRFFMYENSFNVIPLCYDNEIISVNEKFEVNSRYKINFGESQIQNMPSDFKKTSNANLKSYMINDFYEMPNLVYGSFGSSPVTFFMYDKLTEKCYKSQYSLLSIGGECPTRICNITDNGKAFIGIISAFSMNKYLESLKSDTHLSKNQISKIEKINIANNPIIIKYSIK